jgi:hypothetical protein
MGIREFCDIGATRSNSLPNDQTLSRQPRGCCCTDELPTAEQLKAFRGQLTYHSMIHEDMKKFFEGFPPNAHPMAILSAMVALLLSTYYPGTEDDRSDVNIVRLIAKVRTIAAYAYKKSIGQPTIYPRNDLPYCANFLNMMFAVPAEEYKINPVLVRALNMLLILHADHEQNCSTSTVRIVASSRANIFRFDFCRDLCIVGTFAWRSESGSAGNAADDSRRRRRLPEVCLQSKG